MPGRTKNGKTPYRFLGKARSWYHHQGKAPLNAILLPCGSCHGCRLDKSVQWASRIIHEIPFHPASCFLTLTYDDKCIPKNRSLFRPHIQKFFKDLRSRIDYQVEKGEREEVRIKSLYVGEYSDEKERPHYHAAVFGPFSVQGEDPKRIEKEPARSGARQFVHDDIGAVWPYGRHRFSELSFESAAYVARYALKKVSGADAKAYYGDRVPEFLGVSKGFGKEHFEVNFGDVYPGDQVVILDRDQARVLMPPRYYDRLLEKVDPKLYQRVKQKRQEERGTKTTDEWFEYQERMIREEQVRKLVAKQMLIRGVE